MRIRPIALVAVLPLTLSSISWSADFAKGQEAYISGDYQAALTEWQPLAEEGHAGGQFGLGLLYANGFGVPFDNDQASNGIGLPLIKAMPTHSATSPSCMQTAGAYRKATRKHLNGTA